MKKYILFLIVFLACFSAQAQSVQNTNYKLVGRKIIKTTTTTSASASNTTTSSTPTFNTGNRITQENWFNFVDKNLYTPNPGFKAPVISEQ